MIPGGVGDRWSYDMTDGLVTDTTALPVQAEWIGLGATEDRAGRAVVPILAVTRGEGRRTTVRSCMVTQYQRDNGDGLGSASLSMGFADPVCNQTGFPYDQNVRSVSSTQDVPTVRSVMIGSEELELTTVNAVAGIRWEGDGYALFRGSRVDFADGIGMLWSHLFVEYEFGGTDSHRRVLLVGAEVNGQTLGTPRHRDPADPVETFGFGVGSEWEYQVRAETGGDGADATHLERWRVTEQLGPRRFTVAIDDGETAVECAAVLGTIDEVSTLAFVGDGCPLRVPLYQRHTLYGIPDPPGPRRAEYAAPFTLYAAATEPEAIQVAEEEVIAPVSEGVHAGYVTTLVSDGYDTWRYHVAHGIGVHGLRNDDKRWTLTYAAVDGAEYGRRSVDAADGPRRPDLAVRVGPNPAVSDVTVRFDAPAPAEARIEVFDALGRRVRSALLGAVAPGAQTHAVSVSGLAAGTYLVRVVVGDAVGRATIAVAR